MKLFTIQLAQHRLLKNVPLELLDVTVKSGDKTFAPDWDLLKGYKNGTITQDEYTENFKKLMTKSLASNRDRWLEVCNKERVAIACYCAAGDFCHRIVLIDLFKELCAKEGIHFDYCGEITKDGKEINPHMDGLNHINVYSRGRTRLGRRLSNFTEHTVIVDQGRFKSLEGFWYFLKFENIASVEDITPLFFLTGFPAKKYGRELFDKYGKDNKLNKKFKDSFLKGLEFKVRNHPDIYDDFIDSDLPFEHYYVYWGKAGSFKVVNLPNHKWQLNFLTKLRMQLREEKLKNA